MSNMDVHCDLVIKYGNTFEAALNSMTQYQNTLSHSVASDVVSDIIDAALDIAISKSAGPEKRSFVNWAPPCDHKLQDEFEKLAFDIKAENEQLSPNIQQLIEGLNTISVNESSPQSKPEEPIRLDIEMKRLLSDMISPPYPIINYDPVTRKDGVGDQSPQLTMENEIQYLEQEENPEFEAKVVEKKSRVTDLVINSKLILSKLLLDEKTEKSVNEWEETNEEIVKVYKYENDDAIIEGNKDDLEKKPVCRIPEKINILSKNSQVCNEIRPYEGPSGVFDGDEDEEHIIAIPNEKVMDVVDLSKESSFPDEERLLCCGMDCGSNGGKGDEYTLVALNENVNKATKSVLNDQTESTDQLKGKDSKKKKWNLGSRLWGFIKKKPAKKGSASSQSVTAQE